MSALATVRAGSTGSRLPGWLRVVIALTGVYLVWHLTGPVRRNPESRYIDYGFLELLCVLAAILYGKASRRRDLPKELRLSLTAMASAAALQSTGGAFLILSRLSPVGTTVIQGISDCLFVASYLAIIAALFFLPRAKNRAHGIIRASLDALTFVVGAGAPFWFFSLRPLVEASSGMSGAFLIAFPIVAFAGLLTLSWALETRAAFPDRLTFRILLTGLGLLWLADIVYSIGKVSGLQATVLVDVINGLNSLSFCCWVVAGWRFCSEPVKEAEPGSLVEFSPLPLITIVVEVGFIVLIVLLRAPDPQVYPKILVGLSLFLVLLLLRETYVIRDSVRLVAAEARQKSDARFEALVRHSSDVVIVVSHQRRVLFASSASKAILGLEADSFLGRDLLEFIDPEDRAAGLAFFDELVLNPHSTRVIRWGFVTPEKGTSRVETAGSNRLSESEIKGLVLNSRDVSERTHLEEQLRRAEKMEAIGRLGGSVAHDFNNLLSVVLANAELTLGDLPAGSPSWRGIDEIRKAALRGASLTSRLLSFSRAETLKPKAALAAELVKEAILMVEPAVGHRVRVQTVIEPGCGSVKVNPDDFTHALINLGTNARDAMPEGGTLSIVVRTAVLSERLPDSYLEAPPGAYVVVSVKDDGTGMNEATRQHAFEPFFTTKSRAKGTGLGLASVYAMVKASKGGLVLKTAPGKGTLFELWLPEVPTEIVSQAPNKGRAPSGGKETILLVEDEEPLRLAMERILLGAGYQVLTASDALSAHSIYSTSKGFIDLVLADVIMPGQSGLQMALEFRSKNPGQKVLLMSGFTGEQLGSDGPGEAGIRLLRKPFDSDQLKVVLREVIDRPLREA